MKRSTRRGTPSPARDRAGDAHSAARAGRGTPPWRAWLDTPGARLAALPLALLVVFAVHGHAIQTFFAQDDVEFLSRARGLKPTPWSLARPLYEIVAWRLLNLLFGLRPLPYHLLNFALHLANTALVYAIGRRLLGSRVAAFAAALLFGSSAIAFTPLHWAAGLVELMVTGFSLVAFLLWLAGRERNGATALLWLGAAAGLLALLSKESSLLLPLVLVVAHFRMGPSGGATHASEARPTAARVLFPQSAVTAAYAIAFAATLRFVHYVGSEAYAMTTSPIFLARNAATYLRWIASPHVPVRDRVAAMQPDALGAGLVVALAVLILLWLQRRGASHPEEVAAIWFAVFLLPVVPLEHHTYLYYLYLCLPGLCWFVAAVGARAQRWLRDRVPRAAPAGAVALAVGLFGLVALDFEGVRARARLTTGGLLVDKTLREASLLRNALGDLARAGLEPGSRIAFVNAARIRHISLVDTMGVDPSAIGSYIPLEGAMRGGQTLALFHPELHDLGFAHDLPREWEDAEVLLYGLDGHLRAVGRGGRALVALGTQALRAEDWPGAERMLLRSRELGDTLADATFGLVITRGMLGDTVGSDRYAAEFTRRWPQDPRATAIRKGRGAAR